MNSPQNLKEYIEWAKGALSIDFENKEYSILHQVNLVSVVNTIQKTPFYLNLNTKLNQWEKSYEENNNSQLLMDTKGLILLQKSYDSAVNKSFRCNVLWNSNFPDPPDKGWVTPANWFSTLDDLVRGMLVCKFIDGPNFIIDKLKEYTKELDLKCFSKSLQRDEGYYAFHCYIIFQVDLLDKHSTQQANVKLEIQVTTQLQEVLKSLTHQFYEHTRIQPQINKFDRSKWKWEYKSNRFKAGYLCHTLHLLEALIVDLRDSDITAEPTTNDLGDIK